MMTVQARFLNGRFPRSAPLWRSFPFSTRPEISTLFITPTVSYRTLRCAILRKTPTVRKPIIGNPPSVTPPPGGARQKHQDRLPIAHKVPLETINKIRSPRDENRLISTYKLQNRTGPFKPATFTRITSRCHNSCSVRGWLCHL